MVGKPKKNNRVYAAPHFIRQWRTFRGMTIDELATASGFTGSMISQLERGRAIYNQRNLTKIAAALRAEPWQLLCYDPAHPPRLAVSADMAAVLTVVDDAFWARIDEASRDKAARMIVASHDAVLALALTLFSPDAK